jgi:uncharacterized membrane-anchored protein YhcB (DUF1043 family)
MTLAQAGIWHSVTTNVGPVIALLAALAIAYVFLRSNIATKTIENLQTYSQTLEKDRSEWERKFADILDKYNTLEAKYESLVVENHNLRSYVAGTGAIEKLATDMQKHHEEEMRLLTQILANTSNRSTARSRATDSKRSAK